MSRQGPKRPPGGNIDHGKLDQIVANARRDQETREAGYREQSLRLHPWVCGRCGREFNRENLSELTVHHKDGNHNNNPPDGSNWENLCLYCHDNEHSRMEDHRKAGGVSLGEAESAGGAKHNPFAALKGMLGGDEE